MLVLSAADVSRLFTMKQALAAVEVAAALHVNGHSETPQRHHLSTAQPNGEMLVMPGVVSQSTFGLKMWYRFDQALGSIPESSACVLLLDSEYGEEVLLDGGVITDLRTGALTGVAARHLARPDATTVGLIGAGTQARSQAFALVETLPTVRTIRVSSRSRDRLEDFVRRLDEDLTGRKVVVEIAGCIEECVEDADVVVAATTSSHPVVPDRWVKDGALVCGVGSHDPCSSEIEPATVGRAERVVVDTFRGGIDGAGDVAEPMRKGLLRREDVVELGALVTGAALGRTTSTGITIFKSVGFAAADVVAASDVARLAREAGAGVRIDLHAG